jgi:hypothetical protein
MAEPPPTGLRAVSLSDDFFATLGRAEEPAGALPPAPSLLPGPGGVPPSMQPTWGGRPLPQPAPTVWDPPSTTATTTLEALRRRRPKIALRALVPLALIAAVGGGFVVWQRVERTRARIAAAERSDKPRPTLAAPAPTRVSSAPIGAEVYVDGEARGQTPVSLRLPPGEHRVVLMAEGMTLWRGPVDAGASIEAQLSPVQLPPTLVGDAGLKLVCRQPGVFRVIVDGVDTGRTCPVDERIPITPGPHKLTLYAPRGDRTVQVTRPVIVKDRGSSTRIILEEE